MFPHTHILTHKTQDTPTAHTLALTQTEAHTCTRINRHMHQHTHLHTPQSSPADLHAGSLYKGEWEAESYFRTRKDVSVHVCERVRVFVCMCMVIVPIWICIGAAVCV